ncbi:hypothetical protein [Lentzea albidocapillata]|uniref:Secreted protein n=1 Tax=Lentzea albidocapillata TaxID=40571 RepID=A0A1W2DBI5_9PSEU|nr:hypothetical protein [Lentzea albidocapillata]SMC94763.1 hypothetical protein SAMN05660733_02819 [Lentzea albidocapillata]
MTAVAAAALLAPAPAATAAPSVQPTAHGQLSVNSIIIEKPRYHYYARSAMVEGTLDTNECVRVYAATYAGPTRRLDYRSTSLKCDVKVQFKLELKADVRGGADRILLEVRDSAGNVRVSTWNHR